MRNAQWMVEMRKLTSEQESQLYQKYVSHCRKCHFECAQRKCTDFMHATMCNNRLFRRLESYRLLNWIQFMENIFHRFTSKWMLWVVGCVCVCVHAKSSYLLDTIFTIFNLIAMTTPKMIRFQCAHSLCCVCVCGGTADNGNLFDHLLRHRLVFPCSHSMNCYFACTILFIFFCCRHADFHLQRHLSQLRQTNEQKTIKSVICDTMKRQHSQRPYTSLRDDKILKWPTRWPTEYTHMP